MPLIETASPLSSSAHEDRWVVEADRLVRDLVRPRPAVYWTDFLLSWGLGVVAFVALSALAREGAGTHGGPRWALAAVLFAVASLAFYRAVLFVHELAHLPARGFARFRLVWNLLCGIPFLVPSFVYATHPAHHRASEYGSPADGEYVPWGRRPPLGILLFLATGLVAPLVAVARFLVLAPLSWGSSRVATIVQRHASSLVVNPAFERNAPARRELREWRALEAGCLAVLLVAAALIAAGTLAPAWLLQAYLTAVAVFTLNAVRTLAAHRYRHGAGGLSRTDQMLDSVTHARAALLSSLWAPLGLRFHALHHLFPALPYHALPAAHRRLAAALPADSLYRRTESPGLLCSLSRLWRDACASRGRR